MNYRQLCKKLKSTEESFELSESWAAELAERSERRAVQARAEERRLQSQIDEARSREWDRECALSDLKSAQRWGDKHREQVALRRLEAI